MSVFTKILIGCFCVGWLYFQKLFVVEYLFGYGSWLLLRDLNFDFIQIFGCVLLNAIEIVLVAIPIVLLRRKRLHRSVLLFLYVVMISPLAFDILDIFEDKSCLKAWQHPVKYWWYFVISMPLWALVVYYAKKYRTQFNCFDHALLCVIFIAYHFVKKY